MGTLVVVLFDIGSTIDVISNKCKQPVCRLCKLKDSLRAWTWPSLSANFSIALGDSLSLRPLLELGTPMGTDLCPFFCLNFYLFPCSKYTLKDVLPVYQVKECFFLTFQFPLIGLIKLNFSTHSFGYIKRPELSKEI